MKQIPLIEYASWDPLTPEERDDLVGRSFRFAPLTRCEILCNGRLACSTSFTEKEIDRAIGQMEFLKAAFLKEPELSAIKKYCPDANIDPVFTVEIKRWRPRYTDTASGAWMIWADLAVKGWLFGLSSDESHEWTCSARNYERQERCSALDVSMPLALCKVAVSIALHLDGKGAAE